MRLDSLHPGATLDAVRDTIGWEPHVARGPGDHAGADRRRAPPHPGRARSRGRLHEVGATGTYRAAVPAVDAPRRDHRDAIAGAILGDDGLLERRPRPARTGRRRQQPGPDDDPLPRRQRRRRRSVDRPDRRRLAEPSLRVVDRQVVPTARILAALSTALDLTEGQIPGHAAADLLPRDPPGRGDRAAGRRSRDAVQRGPPQGRRLLEQCRRDHPAVRRRRHRRSRAARRRPSAGSLAYAAFTIRSLPDDRAAAAPDPAADPRSA